MTTDNQNEHPPTSDPALASVSGSDAGGESADTTGTCETCGGYGWHPIFDGHGTEIGTPQCETCDGTGRVEKAKPQPNAESSDLRDKPKA